MADILLGFTVDIVQAVHLLAVETKRRLDAAHLLPQTSARCLSLVEEVQAAIENVPDDKATAITLKSMKWWLSLPVRRTSTREYRISRLRTSAARNVQ